MGGRTVWVVLAVGLLGGLALGLIGAAWGRTSAGNTALLVPFGGGPALVAGGWTALLLQNNVVRGALAAAGLALLAALAVVFAPFLLALPEVAVVGPLLAFVSSFPLTADVQPPITARGAIAAAVTTIIAVALILLPSGLGFVVGPLSVPFVLVTPLMAAARPAPTVWLSGVGVLVAVVLGLIVGTR